LPPQSRVWFCHSVQAVKHLRRGSRRSFLVQLNQRPYPLRPRITALPGSQSGYASTVETPRGERRPRGLKPARISRAIRGPRRAALPRDFESKSLRADTTPQDFESESCSPSFFCPINGRIPSGHGMTLPGSQNWIRVHGGGATPGKTTTEAEAGSDFTRYTRPLRQAQGRPGRAALPRDFESKTCENYSFAPSGLARFPIATHGLRRGLHSCAASRLEM